MGRRSVRWPVGVRWIVRLWRLLWAVGRMGWWWLVLWCVGSVWMGWGGMGRMGTVWSLRVVLGVGGITGGHAVGGMVAHSLAFFGDGGAVPRWFADWHADSAHSFVNVKICFTKESAK